MKFDLTSMDSVDQDRLINSLVVPRAIAWVTSQDDQGRGNLAPFSYFTVVSRFPPILMVSFTGPKNTLANIRAVKEFVVNIVSEPFASTMVQSSADYDHGHDEAAELNLELAESSLVSVGRLKQARASLECVLHDIQRIGDGNLVFGEIVHVYVDDDVLSGGRVDPAALQAVGRIGGDYYVTADQPYHLRKPASPCAAQDRR